MIIAKRPRRYEQLGVGDRRFQKKEEGDLLAAAMCLPRGGRTLKLAKLPFGLGCRV